jgi:hypothetical protein
MLTFADCKTSTDLLDIASVGPQSDEFASLTNASIRRLMRRGDWEGTVPRIHVCVKNGCLVFPRYVDHVRKVNVCTRHLPVHNPWYDFISQRDWGCGLWRSWTGAEAAITVTGQASGYSDVYGDGRNIRAYPRTQEDVGKFVRIFGVDNNNQPLRTNNGDGTWSDGVAITLADPYGVASAVGVPVLVRRIDRVVKDVTLGQVLLYAWDTVNLVLEDLARYDPGETSPSYTRYKFNTGSCFTGCCATGQSIVALVKIKFIPVKFDTDLVMIDNLDALAEMFQSLKLRKEGDLDEALKFEASAVRELNRQLENASPDDTFSAVNNVFGGRSFRNRAF